MKRLLKVRKSFAKAKAMTDKTIAKGKAAHKKIQKTKKWVKKGMTISKKNLRMMGY